jgi:hypothetical protein
MTDAVGDLSGTTPDETGRLIRPYAITGGRTDGTTEITLETHIQATPLADDLIAGYRWEAVDLINLVRSPMALIEIAARLTVPIGVAKVLVSDLVADGALQLQVRVEKNYASLLERVLDGVRNL